MGERKLTKAQRAMLEKSAEGTGYTVYGRRDAGVASRLRAMGLVVAPGAVGMINSWQFTPILATPEGRSALEASK